jgi:prophage DNA circulation protein
MSRTNCAIGKDYVPASFKGVQFYCQEADIEGGRRGAEGEFPFGEQTAYADLGRKIRVFHLTAAFREDDHVSDSQALFAACESPGPGMLVHPTRGVVMAACRSVKVKDKLEEAAGETTAELEFVEANSMGLGGFAGSLFGIISSGLNGASSDSFYRDYTPTFVAQPWRADVINTAQSLVGETATTATHVLTAKSPPSMWRTVFKAQEVERDDGLATFAKNVDRAMTDSFTVVAANIPEAVDKFRTFKRLANVATTISAPPAPEVAIKSEEAVLSRHRILSAINMAEAAMGRTYSYLDEGLMAMDQVMKVFEDEAKAAYDVCDNVLFLEIKNYATQFAKMMYDLSYRLPGLVRVNFSGGVHPLTAAYVIYKDAKRHRELETKNIVDANGRFAPMVTGVSPV